jgi:hypothetical protein
VKFRERVTRMTGGFIPPAFSQPMRGRVSKVSVLPKGVRSVVIHFGIDEPGAKDLMPGTLFEGRVLEQPKKATE